MLVNNVQDPHDMLVPLWQLMTMAGSNCYKQCGEDWVNKHVHMNMMSLGLSAAHEYECNVCRVRCLRACDMTMATSGACLCRWQTMAR